MIKKIVIRDVASYDHDGVTFADLQKVNFIYGGNGTGKTTISRLLANWGDAKYSNCQIEWEGKLGWVLVYNKDFREHNLKESIPGVFALGAEGVNSSHEIEELRKKLVEQGNQAKRLTDRIWRTKRNMAMEKGRLANTLWYYLKRPSQIYMDVLFKGEGWFVDMFSLSDKMTECVKQNMMDKTITEDDLNAQYQECFKKGGASEEQREELRKNVLKYLAAQAEGEVKITEHMVSHLQLEIDDWEKEETEAMRVYQATEASIKEHEKALASVQPAIDRINRMLKKSRFTGFSIQPSPTYPNYYEIQREDGSFEGNTLSEGEANFIAFLYYYQLVMGNSIEYNIEGPRILVIDDPMGSMDSNVMLIVSEMIEGLVEEARKSRDNASIEQIFVLTHNRMFHKQVSTRQRRADTHYWMLGKRNGKTYAKDFGKENPVRGEYARLWQELKEAQRGDDRVGLQNAMRRIIEYYFVEIGGYSKHRLVPDHFADDEEELIIVKSLFKWADEGSHSIDDELYAEAPEVMNERYMEVFKRLFEKLGQGEHYNMMMRVD